MGQLLTLPVQRSELIFALLSRMGVDHMSYDERQAAVKAVNQSVNLFVAVIPDYLREVKVRIR